MPYMYALYVCLICMPYMYALYVCLICVPYMYALYVCLICMPYLYAVSVCRICMHRLICMPFTCALYVYRICVRGTCDDVAHAMNSDACLTRTTETMQRSKTCLIRVPCMCTLYAHMCAGRRCLSYTHDRDYEAFKDVPAGRRRPERGGWCPPREFC